MIMAVMTFVMVGCQALPDRCHGGDNPFSIVVLPDTQNDTDSSFGGSPEGGGTQFLIIALEFKPRGETLRWAGQVIEANPDRRCMILTHAYLNSDGTRAMGDFSIFACTRDM
jgi:hypothetical protein